MVIWMIGVLNEKNMWIIQNSGWFPDDLNTIKHKTSIAVKSKSALACKISVVHGVLPLCNHLP